MFALLCLASTNKGYDCFQLEYIAIFLYYVMPCASFQSHQWTWITVWKRWIRVKMSAFMSHVTNRVALLCYFKLCASFRNHLLFPTGIRVRKRPIWVQVYTFFGRVTLTFYGWPWKTIGHLSWETSSCVHHFIAICEFKLELWSGNG